MTVIDLRDLPPDTDDEPVTDTCVYEVDRLGTSDYCGLPLPDRADRDQLFCAYHHGAVDRGDISWEEYQTYRAHYRV